MNTFLLLSTLMAGAALGTQTNAATTPGFRIQTQLELEQSGKNIKSARESHLTEQANWVTLTEATQGVQVLGHLTNKTDQTARLDMIVLDTTQTPNGVLSTPSVIVRYGLPATLTETTNTSGGNQDKLAVTITIRRETISAN